MIRVNYIVRKVFIVIITFNTCYSSFSQNDSLYDGIPIKYFNKVVTDTDDSVVIRSMPDQSSSVVSILPDNNSLTIIHATDKHEIIAKADGQWLKVSFKDTKGVRKVGYIFDFFTKIETKWIKVRFVGFSCGDYCYFDFESEGVLFTIGGGYFNDRVAKKHILNSEDGSENPEMIDKYFKIKICTNKVRDVMATELISEKIEYSRAFLIHHIKKVK